MENRDGRHSEMIMQLLCHVTSSPHTVDVEGGIFRHTIYPPSVVVVAFIFLELWRGEGGFPPPGCRRPDRVNGAMASQMGKQKL